MVEIHGFAKCPFAFRCRITATEKRVRFDWLPVDVANPDPRALAGNPNRRSPLLVHGDLTLTGSSVIMQYLDEAFDGPSLMPRDPRAAALLRMTRNEVAGLLFDGRKELDAEARGRVEAGLTKLDEKLAAAPWLGGETPSLVDIEIWPWLTLLAKTTPLEDRVAHYWERLAARPSHHETNPY